MHLFKVHFRMKLTYRTIPYDDDDELQGADVEISKSGENPGGDIRNKTQWDDDCPWSEWYSSEDPVKGELFCVIEERVLSFMYSWNNSFLLHHILLLPTVGDVSDG